MPRARVMVVCYEANLAMVLICLRSVRVLCVCHRFSREWRRSPCLGARGRRRGAVVPSSASRSLLSASISQRAGDRLFLCVARVRLRKQQEGSLTGSIISTRIKH